MGITSSYQDFRLDLTGRIREVGVSDEAPDRDDGGDSAASLILSKPIYDFGLQDSREGRIGLQLDALELQKRLLIEQRRLDILEKYLFRRCGLCTKISLCPGEILFVNIADDQPGASCVQLTAEVVTHLPHTLYRNP